MAVHDEQMKVVNESMTTTNAYAASAQTVINETKKEEADAEDSASAKAEKLRLMLAKSKEIETKNKEIRKGLNRAEPNTVEMKDKIESKQRLIDSLEAKVAHQNRLLQQSAVRASTSGHAAMTAAMRAGAKEDVALTIGFDVTKKLESESGKLQAKAKAEGFITASQMLAVGDQKDSTAWTKAAGGAGERVSQEGGTKAVAAEVEGAIMAQFYLKSGKGTHRAIMQAAKMATHGGKLAQALSAGLAIQRSGASAAQAGKAAAMAGKHAGLRGLDLQKAAAEAAGAAALAGAAGSKSQPAAPPAAQPTAQPAADVSTTTTPDSKPAPAAGGNKDSTSAAAAPAKNGDTAAPGATTTKTAKRAGATGAKSDKASAPVKNVPTSAPAAPTPSPTRDNLLTLAQEELAKQREHIKTLIAKLDGEVGIQPLNGTAL
jgi:hypothetical protein